MSDESTRPQYEVSEQEIFENPDPALWGRAFVERVLPPEARDDREWIEVWFQNAFAVKEIEVRMNIATRLAHAEIVEPIDPDPLTAAKGLKEQIGTLILKGTL